MATRNDEVMEMVRQRLKEKPDVELRELYERAQQIDPEVANLSTRQFYARYPLQIKRRPQGAGGGAGRAQKGQTKSTTRQTGRGQAKTQAQPQTQEQSSAESATPQSTQRRRRRSQRNEAESRDAVRGVFLRFAGEVAQAESRSEVVGVISNVDGYVDEVVTLINRT